jgi:hypothetical protein
MTCHCTPCMPRCIPARNTRIGGEGACWRNRQDQGQRRDAAEVARVKQQYIAQDAYKRDGTAAIASEINEWIGVGDWTLYVTFPQKVQEVTPADVQRVAKKYLNEDQSTTAGSCRWRRRGERLVIRQGLMILLLLLRNVSAPREHGENKAPCHHRRHRRDDVSHRCEGRGGDRRALPAGDAMARAAISPFRR